MYYHIIEGTPNGQYNATNKARADVDEILERNFSKPFFVSTRFEVQTNKLLKWKQLIGYLKNYYTWKESMKAIKKNDVVVIQYPLTNAMLNFQKIVSNLTNKGVKVILLIHDLDSLRGNSGGRIKNEDLKVPINSTYIIAHNDAMKSKLIEMGNDPKKIIKLEIFDYLYHRPLTYKQHNVKDNIIVAGNLSLEKAKYLAYLNRMKNLQFNLYGKGYEANKDDINVHYKGAFLPEDLIDIAEGGFGLVWDGDSINTCSGDYGEYLRYNNPHKISLYLSAGIPVIVWRESAMAKFVKENGVGIVVQSVLDLGNVLEGITENDYLIMVNNAKKVSREIVGGSKLTSALKKINEFIASE